MPFNYLGAPNFVGALKTKFLQPLGDKIRIKLALWKDKTLSTMGRVQLVNSIIYAFLSYNFQVYKWPCNLLWRVDKGIKKFIWTGDINKQGLVIVKWAKVCSLRSDGGLQVSKCINGHLICFGELIKGSKNLSGLGTLTSKVLLLSNGLKFAVSDLMVVYKFLISRWRIKPIFLNMPWILLRMIGLGLL